MNRLPRVVRGGGVILSLLLLAAASGCRDTSKERELQSQLDQARAEKAAAEETGRTLQAQIARMQSEKAAFDEANRLVGTWRYRGSPVTYKHITPTGWTLIELDSFGRVTRSKGGTYSLQDSTYNEKINYDSYVSSSTPDQNTFTCELDGDTWHHKILSKTTNASTGQQETTLLFHEIWDRVRP